jgi:hypothetical protein
MNPKPGWQTSEFWIALATKVLALGAAFGAISVADEQNLAKTISSAILGVFSILAAAKVLAEYIKGRAYVKSHMIFLLIFGLGAMEALGAGLLTSPAHAQTAPLPVWLPWRQRVEQHMAQHTGQTDPQVLSLLNQLNAQQQEILAWVRQHPNGPAQPQQPQLIVLNPQQGGPLQQIPLGGPPLQNIPLGGPPKQDIPLGGPPKQDIPLGPPPQQQIPLGPQPRQQIPLGPMPPIPSRPTGYQRYTRVVSWEPALWK